MRCIQIRVFIMLNEERCIEVTAATMISNTEAKQNFLKEAPSDDVIAISERLMKQNIHAYELLAK